VTKWNGFIWRAVDKHKHETFGSIKGATIDYWLRDCQLVPVPVPDGGVVSRSPRNSATAAPAQFL